MQVIMPMAGSGTRFSKEGYDVIKPLIRVGKKHMVQHAIEMFPKGTRFIFICRKDHLESTELRSVLLHSAPNSEIISIDGHTGGPVVTVLAAESKISDSEETIVAYCDFTVEWNYKDFISSMHNQDVDGGIPVFRGFQAAQFTGTTYAYVRVDTNMRAMEIREKKSFTEDKASEFASAGIYYFRNGSIMKKYFRRAEADGLAVNGELYASLPFNPMIKDGLKVKAFEVKKFICFGTPNDVRMYQFWHDYFKGH
jgi:NDP-sugar pyrophosphorylase family protein